MGTNLPKPNRSDRIFAEQTLVDGFKTHAGFLSSLAIDGAVRTSAEIVNTVQSRIDASKAVEAAHAAWLAALAAEAQVLEETSVVLAGAKQGVLTAFSGHATELAAFGLTAPVRHTMTVDEKRAAVAKGKATRAARHTMGRRQKAAIKGVVAESTAAPAAPPLLPPVSSGSRPA
ncbi:MAG TPA: hypothetical protein VHV30_07635 [Polyangiaceae bacterium]|jgi:hypothetical protein|nr:hypothetical protein [Polyangiaceae bacterium]